MKNAKKIDDKVKRKEVVFLATEGEHGKRSNIQVIVTRRGIEVDGWYDSFVRIGEKLCLTWRQIENARLQVSEVQKRKRSTKTKKR